MTLGVKPVSMKRCEKICFFFFFVLDGDSGGTGSSTEAKEKCFRIVMTSEPK